MHKYAHVCTSMQKWWTMAVVRLKMGMYVQKYAEATETMAVVRLANLLHLWSTP